MCTRTEVTASVPQAISNIEVEYEPCASAPFEKCQKIEQSSKGRFTDTQV